MEPITRRAAIGLLAAATTGLSGSAQEQASGRTVQSLTGEWRFQADPSNAGLQEGWYRRRFPESLKLPGSLEMNGQGVLNTEYSAQALNRKYVPQPGGVWYQREFEAPSSWSGRRVALVLERSSNSRVWLDGREVGEPQNSRRAPHVHELGGSIPPGRHALTILAGAALPGRIELVVTDRVWVRQVRVTPDVAGKRARLSVEVANETVGNVKGVLQLAARSFNSSRTHEPALVELPFEAPPGRRRLEAELTMGGGMLLWDEFQPALYRLTTALKASGAGASYADTAQTSFGMREISTRSGRLQVNGRTVFLRGRSNGGGISPMTGQPLFDLDGWRRYFRNNKDYGLNLLRDSSFPPEAAFEAADLEGVYIQAELGARNPVIAEGIQSAVEEGTRFQEAFGNHPSFCFFPLGNELFGERAAMAEIVSRLRAQDGRRLYASGSNNFWGAQRYQPGDDYWVTWRTRKGEEGAVRASYACTNLPAGHIEAGPPNTLRSYSQSLEGIPVPVVAHEIGEYQIYPNYDEIPKYTGALQPRDFEIFRNRLNQAGMLDQWKDFFRASGALAVLCYKEDVEAALRTPGFGGFYILDLADRHVDEGALVGILDAFNDSKGLVTPEDWRQFCSPTVPLLRFDKYTWNSAETFAAEVLVAHYGPADLRNAVVAWSLRNAASQVVQGGELPLALIPQGAAANLGRVSFPLVTLKTPARYDLELLVRGTPFRNQWPVWVFDRSIDTRPPAGLRPARNLDAAAQQRLVEGDTVLLMPALEDWELSHQMAPRYVDGQFPTDFWSYRMFQDHCLSREMKPSAGTLGLLMDPKHPALARFPTEYHTNWQWWHLIKNSRAVVLDGAPAGYRPIVQVIDNVSRNYKLGMIFEFRAGKGKLLVCTADLLKLKERPEAGQLLASLLAYAGSEEFQPATTIGLTALKRIMGIQVVHA